MGFSLIWFLVAQIPQLYVTLDTINRITLNPLFVKEKTQQGRAVQFLILGSGVKQNVPYLKRILLMQSSMYDTIYEPQSSKAAGYVPREKLEHIQCK
jgi:hypothetical protein